MTNVAMAIHQDLAQTGIDVESVNTILNLTLDYERNFQTSFNRQATQETAENPSKP